MNHTKNTKSRVITIFACLLLAVSALMGPLTPDHYYSEREKRNLTQLPIRRKPSFRAAARQAAANSC